MLLWTSGKFRDCIRPDSNIPIDAKKVASKTQIKPFTTPVSIDHWVVLSSFENITPKPIIPMTAPTIACELDTGTRGMAGKFVEFKKLLIPWDAKTNNTSLMLD